MITSTAARPDDPLLVQIADYVAAPVAFSANAYATARCSLLDSIACAIEAVRHRDCLSLLGPHVPGTVVPNGSRVPGTSHRLDPVKAAFDTGTAIRWLDYNDSWFALEAGHPSDNLGAILAVADHLGQGPQPELDVKSVLDALIKAYEIQCVLTLENSFLAHGLDATVLLAVASAAVATQLLGGTKQQIVAAVSNAWLDGANPRAYRLGANTGPRKSWASGDATARGVRHALFALRGEPGYPAALSAPKYGFVDSIMRGKPIVAPRPFGSYIIENILFKVPFPTEFHAQTASECAARLHPMVKGRLDEIKAIRIRTHMRTIHTIDKKGPLRNAADRDHCLQYILAVVLKRGKITSEDYEDDAARDPQLDRLREKMSVAEDESFTRDFYDPEKRANPNAIQAEFNDGSRLPEVRVDFPLGHPRRRAEGLPLVVEKFRHAVGAAFPGRRSERILEAVAEPGAFEAMRLRSFMDLLAR
ncbi:MAG: bifunctional 2-methylcitrate dehydratase/aconitate hydratase [Betaproteobacteria bacterium]|nr:bifunctional 2-methylcitrate dehydratase/aconitate hydratase [Betaproteobacteria bacterium]